MSDVDLATRDAARRILAPGTPEDGPSGDARAVLERFYALATLLPGEHSRDPQRDPYVEYHFSMPQGLSPRAHRPAESAGGDGHSRASSSHRRTPNRGSGRPATTRAAIVALASHRASVPIAAVVAVAAAIVLLGGALLLTRDAFEPQRAIYLTGTGAAGNAAGAVLVDADELILFASGLSRLERGYRYVAWEVRAGRHRRIGAMVALGDGRARLRVRRSRENLPDLVEITIEPSTSTDGPDGPRVLVGSPSVH